VIAAGQNRMSFQGKELKSLPETIWNETLRDARNNSHPINFHQLFCFLSCFALLFIRFDYNLKTVNIYTLAQVYSAIKITKAQTHTQIVLAGPSFHCFPGFILWRVSSFRFAMPSPFSHLPADAYNYGNFKSGPRTEHPEQAQINPNEKSTRKVNTRCKANENFYKNKRQGISIKSRQYERNKQNPHAY